MVTVILSHEVSDFSTWKARFDSGAPLREQAGVKTIQVFTEVGNSNKVSVITEFPSAEAVQGFLSNPQLKSDMAAAGVVGAPELKILTKVD